MITITHTPPKLERSPSHYETITIAGEEFRLIDPKLFYAGRCSLGRGLFCQIDLEQGDIWWLNELNDTRFVKKLISEAEFNRLHPMLKEFVMTYGYTDPDTKLIVLCTNPFDLTNHAKHAEANSISDKYGNSVASKFIEAGQEIRISYDYDAMLSLIHKFPDLGRLFSLDQLSDPTFLSSPATDHTQAIAFLENL
jgi:hypothetical protein